MVVSMVAAGSPAASTAVVASVREAARANRSRQRQFLYEASLSE